MMTRNAPPWNLFKMLLKSHECYLLVGITCLLFGDDDSRDVNNV